MIFKSRPTLIIVLIILLLVGISLVWSARKPISSLPSVEAQTAPPAEGSLRWYAQQSAANGETQFALILSPRIPVAGSLSDAIEDYGLVVGELVTQESVWYDPPDKIYTWYKFRLTETLKQKPFVACATCTFTPTPPVTSLVDKKSNPTISEHFRNGALKTLPILRLSPKMLRSLFPDNFFLVQ